MSTVNKNGSSVGKNWPFLILFFLHQVRSEERKEDINVIRYHCCTTACLKNLNNLLHLRTILPSQTSLKIVQIVEVASEREVRLETKGMDQWTMTHSNFSMWALSQKWSVAKLHPQNLLFFGLVQVTHFRTSHGSILSQALTKVRVFSWLSKSAVSVPQSRKPTCHQTIYWEH